MMPRPIVSSLSFAPKGALVRPNQEPAARLDQRPALARKIMPPRRRRVGKAFSPGLRLVEVLDLRYRPAWNGAQKSANENRAVRHAEDRACSTRYDAPFCRRDFSCGPADLNAGRI